MPVHFGINFTHLNTLTNEDIINYYEPRKEWYSRRTLIDGICESVHDDNPTWSILSANYCNNNDSINILTGDLREKKETYNENDFTVSFGNISLNYSSVD